MDIYLDKIRKNIQRERNDNIYCDKHESTEDCYLFYFVLHGIIGTFMCTVGITGNILSFIIIRKINNNKMSVTKFLLKSLAIVDSTILVIFVFPFVITFPFGLLPGCENHQQCLPVLSSVRGISFVLCVSYDIRVDYLFTHTS